MCIFSSEKTAKRSLNDVRHVHEMPLVVIAVGGPYFTQAGVILHSGRRREISLLRVQGRTDADGRRKCGHLYSRPRSSGPKLGPAAAAAVPHFPFLLEASARCQMARCGAAPGKNGRHADNNEPLLRTSYSSKDREILKTCRDNIGTLRRERMRKLRAKEGWLPLSNVANHTSGRRPPLFSV